MDKSTDHHITLENNRPGTASWKLNNPATKREIEGYASRASINQGESIDLFVNTASETFSLEIFRMGWYDGLGGRSMAQPVLLAGTMQDIPLPDEETGLVECRWNAPYSLKTDPTWSTGIYVVKLQEQSHNKQSYIIFVIRDDRHSPDIVFQLPVTTYQAYNYWGGKSLYDWGSGNSDEWGTLSGSRASHVSFSRPYACSNNKKAAYGMGAGEFFTNVQPVTTHDLPISSASWDYNMVRWLEKNKYDVGYITNVDTHVDHKLLDNGRIFMSHGHDEYWSAEMRANVEKSSKNGTHLTFFSSNTIFWQIRLEPSVFSQQPYRTIVCYKDLAKDPVTNNLATINFRDDPVNNPESSLIGVQHFMDPVDGDIIISNAAHWVFEGLKIENGHRLQGLLGYEIDGITKHSPKNITVLATTPGKNLLENNYAYTAKIMFKRIRRKFNGILTHKLKFSKATMNIVSTITILFLLLGAGAIIRIMGTSGIVVVMGLMGLLLAGLMVWFTKSLRALNKRIVKHGDSHMSIYETVSGSKVFASGSMQWCWGLDDYNVPELRNSRKSTEAETVTHNILRAFGASTASKTKKSTD